MTNKPQKKCIFLLLLIMKLVYPTYFPEIWSQDKSGFLKNYKLFSTNLPYISLLQKQYNVVFQNGFRFLIPQVPKRILKYFPLLKTSKVSESGIWLWLHVCFQNWATFWKYISICLSSHFPLTINSIVAKTVTPSLIYELNFLASLSNNDYYSGFWGLSNSHSSEASIKATNRSNPIGKFLW